MNIDKHYWTSFHFRKDYIPDIPCPTCHAGRLKKAKDFLTRETRRSRELQSKVYFDVMDYEEKFLGFLVCDNRSCKENVAVIGKMYAEPDLDNSKLDEDGMYLGQLYYTHYQPEYFSPPLEIFNLKKEYPFSVNKALRAAFSLYFTDIESCANKIRIAIELLLDELGINKTYISKKGKRELIKLNDRIEKYRSKNNEIADLLLSVKWIGNYGSHRESLKKEDLIDAFSFLQTSLDKLYDKSLKKILTLSQTINKKKKPLSKIKVKKKSIL